MIVSIIKLFEGKIALFLDKLTVGSPIVFMIVAVIIFGLGQYVENFEFLPEILQQPFVKELFVYLAALLLRTRTKRHINSPGDEAGVNIQSIDYDD